MWSFSQVPLFPNWTAPPQQTTMIHRSFSQIHTQFNNHSKTPKKARQKERARRKNTHSHTSHTDYCCYQMHELLKTFCTFLYVAYSKQKEAVRSCTVHTVSSIGKVSIEGMLELVIYSSHGETISSVGKINLASIYNNLSSILTFFPFISRTSSWSTQIAHCLVSDWYAWLWWITYVSYPQHPVASKSRIYSI